jgi:glycosyltransferase involved in cell wall biosynthesis
MSSILVVSEIFYPEGGGAEKATYLILRYLAQHNFKITVVTGTKNPIKIQGIKYYITSYLKSSNRPIRWMLTRMLATNSYFIRLLKEHDILYIPLAAYPLISLAKKRGLRVIVHLHNYMPVRYSSVKYFFEPDVINILDEFKLAILHERWAHGSIIRTLLSPLSYTIYLLNKKQIREADKIICVSRRQAEILARNDPYLLNKIEVIYNPISPELLNNDITKKLNETPTFLYIGGDSFIKGFHILLQALRNLGKSGIRAKFIFAGTYNQQSVRILKSIGDKYDSFDIQLIGKVKDEEILKLHHETWALLFPSIAEEPLPYAIVEAGLAGTIPVSSNVGGIAEILGGTPAENYIFKAGDAKELSKKIEMFVNEKPYTIMNEGKEIRKFVLRRLKNSLNNLGRIFISISSDSSTIQRFNRKMPNSFL